MCSKRQRRSDIEPSNTILKWNIKGGLKKLGPPQQLTSRNLNNYKMKSIKCSISILRFSFCSCSSSLMAAAEVALASSSCLWCFISKRCCSARYCFFSACFCTLNRSAFFAVIHSLDVFYRFKIILVGPICFGQIQSVLVGLKRFGLSIMVWTDLNELDPSKTNWTNKSILDL